MADWEEHINFFPGLGNSCFGVAETKPQYSPTGYRMKGRGKNK